MTDSKEETPNIGVTVAESVRQSPFVQERASVPLRVTCYGSSSSKTPAQYLQEAHHLGYILARRGHTCVNGAGSFGCMAAMNDGADAGEGHIVGVIHEMWLVDQQDWQSSTNKKIPIQKDRSLRDGGAHPVFEFSSSSSTTKRTSGPTREMLVAGGKDLQERKRLLVENAQALVVLPGGPGTFDELWEAACARNIGLQTSLPIVCINVDNYYQPFRDMLQRAYDDELTKLKPDEIIHFEDSAEAAVRWLETIQEKEGAPKVVLQKRPSTLRKSSFLGGGTVLGANSWSSSVTRSFAWLTESFRTSKVSERTTESESEDLNASVNPAQASALWVFVAGLATGVLLHHVSSRAR